MLWEYSLGSDEDPIHTSLLVADGLLVAGTYAGKVIALTVGAPPAAAEDPQAALKRGDHRTAADAFALAGNLRQAAELYASELREPGKALALYEHAGLFREAGQLAQAQGLHHEALAYFESADDLLSQAQALLALGDEREAAQRYEQAGELQTAAELYEKVGQARKALDLYRKLGNLPNILRLAAQVTFSPSDIEFLAQQGQLVEAGEAAQKAGTLDWAAKLFRQAGEGPKELEALSALVAKQPEPWALERLAELARGMGKFQQEAQVCEQLGRPQRTADAYQRAARQAEKIEPDNEAHIAALYERAAHFFNETGMEDEYQQCWAKHVYYARLPQVVVEGTTEKAFREGEWNRMTIRVRNTGRGVAFNIQVNVSRDRFEIDTSATGPLVGNLAPQRERVTAIHVRPLKDQVGDAVPLQLEWAWQREDRREFHDCASASVPVKRHGESPTGGTPVVINAGTYVAGGTYIGGDQVQDGGQKGDKVEIRRDEGVRLHASESSQPGPQALCPNCHLPLPADATFCDGCGQPVGQSSQEK